MVTRRLAVITDALEDARRKGLADDLGAYFNPAAFFDEVFVISPMEKWREKRPGFEVIPARDVELPGLLKEFKIDVCRAYGGRWPLEMAVFYRAEKVPVVVSIHDRRPGMLSSAVRWADVVLCVSEQARQQVLRHHHHPERVWLRPNGVDLGRMKPMDDKFFPELDRHHPFEKVILHVGRKSTEKNIELLIRALLHLPDGIGLVMIGPGDDAPLRALARQLGVGHRCSFVETVPNEKLAEYYNWADCFCLPSFDEAMSNVVLEAMACGCPSILSHAAAAGVGAVHGKEAWLVDDLRSPQSLAAAANRIFQDNALAGTLRENGFLTAAVYDKRITSRTEASQYQMILEMRDKGLFQISPLERALRVSDQQARRLWRAAVRRCV